MNDIDFEVVSDDLWNTAVTSRAGTRKNSPLMQQLLSGETVFVKNKTYNQLNGFYETARSMGYTLSMKKATLKDSHGTDITGHLMKLSVAEKNGN